MQTTKQPYELLIRWDQHGQLAGAHVQYRYVIKDDGKLIGESLGTAEPLALDGFPLASLLTDAQAQALADNMQLRQAVQDAHHENHVLKQQLDDLQRMAATPELSA